MDLTGSINIKVNLNAVVRYYLRHGVVTDPGKHEYMYEGLPDDIPGLVKVVQGVFEVIRHFQDH